MKKYRLTKITVKTREIISLQKDERGEIQNPVCPICHAPLSAALPAAAENSAAAKNTEKQTNELPPVKVSDNADEKLKGDL